MFDYGNKDTSLTKDFKGMYTIDNQPWPKYSVHFKLFFFFRWDTFEIRQRFSANVEFHLVHEGGAVAAKEGALSTEDKVRIAGKR